MAKTNEKTAAKAATVSPSDAKREIASSIASGPKAVYNPILNRYEFLFLVACTDANPNGDPDMDDMPRVDPETMHGFITDVATKARLREYLAMVHGSEPGMNMSIVAETNYNRVLAEAKESAGVALTDVTVPAVRKACDHAKKLWFDVRAFGGVMAVGPNIGHVRGPVQFAFGRSVDPVLPMDIGINRVSKAIEVKGATTASDYITDEANSDPSGLRTKGRKHFIPFGLYEIHGFVSANQAQKTGFDEQDLQYLFEALANMYDATRSASKGTMSVVSPVIVFKHVGDPNIPAEHARNQALLGRAPAQKLFELVQVAKKPGVEFPRSHWDYDAVINLSACPKGIEIGFLDSYSQEGIVWGKLPSTQTWMKSV